jgi:hypothetical protein
MHLFSFPYPPSLNHFTTIYHITGWGGLATAMPISNYSRSSK